MDVDPKKLTQVLEILRERDSLTKLRLNQNRLGDKGAEMIAKFLTETKVLEELELNKNSIGSDGAVHLANGLKLNKSLSKLCLGSNQIKDSGAKAVSLAIETHPFLQYLKLDNNFISNESVPFFLETLKKNPEIIFLSLKSEALRDESILGKVEELLQRNKKFRDDAQKKKHEYLKVLSSPRSSLKGPWRRCKLLVIGQGRVGKTGTVRSLLDLPFDHNLESTIVSNVTEVSVRNKGWTNAQDDRIIMDNATAVALTMVNQNLGDTYKRKQLEKLSLDEKAMKLEEQISKVELEELEEREVSAITPEVFKGLSPVRKREVREMMARVNERKNNKLNLTKPNFKQKKLYTRQELIEISRENNLKREKAEQDAFNLEAFPAPVEEAAPSKADGAVSAEEFRRLSPAEKKKYREEMTKKKEQLKDVTESTLNEKKIKQMTENGGVFKETSRALPELRFSIWDLGGQTVFHTIHHLFVSDLALYLFVFDMRKFIQVEAIDTETKEHLDFWSRTLKVHADNCPVVLVGTFLDEISDLALIKNISLDIYLAKVNKNLREVLDIDYSKVAMNDRQKLCFFPVDNRHNKGTFQLKKCLKEVAEKQEFINYLVDLRWLRTLDVILEDNRHRFLEKNNDLFVPANTNLIAPAPIIPDTLDDVTVNLRKDLFSLEYFEGITIEEQNQMLQTLCLAVNNTYTALDLKADLDLFDRVYNTTATDLIGLGGLFIRFVHVSTQPEQIYADPRGSMQEFGRFLRNKFDETRVAEAATRDANINRLLNVGNNNNNLPGNNIVADEGENAPQLPVREATMGDLLRKLYGGNEFKGWVTLDYVLSVARRFAIESVSEVEEMLNLFHKLGALFYLNSSQALREIVTVDVMWMISAVGKIIRDPQFHRKNLNNHEIETLKLEKDVEQMFDKGLVSLDLLEYFWRKQQKSAFLIEIMKQALLLSEWRFKQKTADELYLIPSLLADNPAQLQNFFSETDSLETYKAQYVFQKNCLIDGVFERIVCLLISINAEELSSPVLSKNFCRAFVRDEEIKTESNEIVLIRESDCITCFSLSALNASYNRGLVNKLLQKVKSDLTLNNFTWEILLEDKKRNKMVSVHESNALKLFPWTTTVTFQDSISAKNMGLDLSGFVDNL